MPFSADKPDATDEDGIPSLEDYLRGELEAMLECESVAAVMDIEYLDPEPGAPVGEVDIEHHGAFYKVRRIVLELERIEDADEEDDDLEDAPEGENA